MAGTQLGAALRQIHHLFTEGSLAGLSDAELLERFLDSRDEAAFAALVERHGALVLATCRALVRDPSDAEDAFQATFLILARKAVAIRDRATLGGWLHRVSRRVAVQARTDAGRRRRREREAGLLRYAGPAGSPCLHDPCVALHEEIDRLSDRHRLPLVLCHLEGLPHSQAAQQLRWSERTLRRRLAEARERLRLRLDRRGVALPAAALATALARQSSAAVPAAWAVAAVRSATAGAGAPMAVAALAREVIRGLLLTRIKFAAVALLGAGMAALLSVVVLARISGNDEQSIPRLPAVSEAGGQAPAPAAPSGPGESLTYAGRVLDPLGRPFAGARLSLEYEPSGDKDPRGSTTRATSGADGQFRFDVPKSLFDPVYEDEPWKGNGVVAKAEGFGLGIGPNPEGAGPLILRLAEDLPIAGRVLDLQGRPVAGIAIRPFSLQATARGELDPILRTYTDRKAAAEHPVPDRIFADIPDQVPPATTGSDGRFRLTGLGRERLVGVMIEGPGIETASVLIMTRRADTIRVTPPGDHPYTIYGAEFEHIAGPSQPIAGVVRDADTGAPLEGIEVQGNHPAGFINHVKAVTDREGRYRLEGLPAGRQAHLSVVDTRERPYLRAARYVSNDLAAQPAEVSFTLKRGLWVRGRVTDRLTGRPIRGQVDYFAFRDNPHLDEAPHFSDDHRNELKWTAPDGSYRVAALPGRGMIAVKAHAREDYCVGVGAEEIRGDDPKGLFPTRPGFCTASNYNTLAEVCPPEGVSEMTRDLTVDPGRSVQVAVLDPEGTPLAGAVVLNREKPWFDWPLVPLETAEFSVVRLKAGEARTLTIVHDGRKLSGTLVVRGNAPDLGAASNTHASPIAVRLRPWGVVTGRLVDDQGEPRSGVTIRGMDRPWFDPDDGGVTPAVPVGEDGRFRIEGLVPGRSYTFRVARRRSEEGTLIEGLTVAPGEARDLGDVCVQKPR